ncbi:MAG: OB-fold domain-containing protein [Acidimicrobiales bacterium]|nr:OB-fold domain-containing protein [Acidimicrobiales bacterium]
MAELNGKPRPAPIPTTKPFWDALSEDRIHLQHCADCGSWVYYPRRRCPSCLSAALDWQEVSGRGHLYSWTIGRQPTHPAFGDEGPQRLIVVELEEGVRLTTTLVDGDDADLVVGRAVEPVFDHGADGMTLLRFRPTRD